MPLASPSSLTSNTLATFLDHVPISTNNAEKWKPKQMGSNSGRGLLSPIQGSICNPGRWEVNPTPSFSQHRNSGRSSKQLQQYVYNPRNVYREDQMVIAFLDIRNECNGLHLDSPLNCSCIIIYYKMWYITNVLSSMSSVWITVLHHLWYFRKIVSHCWTSKVTVNHCYSCMLDL